MAHRRGATERPILSQERIMDLCDEVIGMTAAEHATVYVEHTARSVTRMVNGSVQSADNGDVLKIGFGTSYNLLWTYMQTDQIDRNVLQAMVRRCEKAALDFVGPEQNIGSTKELDTQDTYVPVALWHDSTVEGMRTSRETLLPNILRPLAKQGLQGTGFVGFVARAKAVMTKQKIHAYYDETDCEVSVTAKTRDNTSSGWGGQANRRWEAIDPAAITAQAADLALRGVNPRAVEPGRYTVILTPEAAAQMFRYFAFLFDGMMTEWGWTPFFKHGFPANKIGEKVFDAQVTMSSDPGDPEGGFSPFFWDAYANPVMEWVKNGVLTHLAWGSSPQAAASRGLAYSEQPYSLRMAGGSSSIEQMIASCKEGIYVNHFAGVDMTQENGKTGLMTGTTRDGCFMVKDGKIELPVKNFRFLDSPMFMLNNIIALGPPKRVAYGYTPRSQDEWPYDGDWPRRPMILPPMMIRDFNFTSLADAV